MAPRTFRLKQRSLLGAFLFPRFHERQSAVTIKSNFRTCGKRKDGLNHEKDPENADNVKQYTLNIIKDTDEEPEGILGLFGITVNGKIINPVGNVYDAYISDNTDNVTVMAMTIRNTDLVSVGDNPQEVYKTTVTLDTKDEVSTYKIIVKDPKNLANKKEYVLNIRKPSSDTTLKSITIGNKEFSEVAKRENGTNNYSVSI